jgi:hypothetical protein
MSLIEDVLAKTRLPFRVGSQSRFFSNDAQHAPIAISLATSKLRMSWEIRALNHPAHCKIVYMQRILMIGATGRAATFFFN